jgi:hypothetical protein
VIDWQFDRAQAIRAITWVIGLVEEAVRQGRRPKVAEWVIARSD